MQKWHRGSTVLQAGHRSLNPKYICNRCASRQLHLSSPLLDDQKKSDNAASPSRNPKPPPPRIGARKTGSQSASRMIMGLRGAAPGGFGSSPKTTPRSEDTRPPRLGQPFNKQGSQRQSGSNSDRKPGNSTNSRPERYQNRNRRPGGATSPAARGSVHLVPGQQRARIPDATTAAITGSAPDDDEEESLSDYLEEGEELNLDNDEDEHADDDAAEDEFDPSLQHLEWADQQVRGKPVAFKPTTHQNTDLVTNRTSALAGKAGMLAELEVAMANLSRRNDRSWVHDEPVARRLIAGKLVRFKDDEERKRITLLAEDLAARNANVAMWTQEGEPTFVNKEDVGFVPIPQEYRKLLGDRAMAGHYPAVEGVKGKTEKEKTSSQVKTALQINNTYSPSQQKAFTDFLERMWPEQRVGSAAAKKQ